MSTSEIDAARRQLQELRELSESPVAIERAQARLRDAESAAGVGTVDASDPLGELGSPDPIVEALPPKEVKKPATTRRKRKKASDA